MKVSIQDATKAQLNYAIAVSQGVKIKPPEFASYEKVKDLALPFTLWEVNQNTLPDGKWTFTVSPIKVTRCDDRGGIALLSIDFTDQDGRKCVGSVEMFHMDKESAYYEIECIEKGLIEDGYDYTGDWNLCGKLIDKYPHVASHAVHLSIVSEDAKSEIVRGVLRFLYYKEIEVPDDLS